MNDAREQALAAPTVPDEATERGELLRFIHVLAAVSVAFALAEGGAGLAFGSARALITAAFAAALAIWLESASRLGLASRSISWVVTGIAVAVWIVALAVGVLQPALAMVAVVGMLIPIAVALPRVEVRPLRTLMFVAWGTTIATAAAGLLPDDPAIPTEVLGFVRLWGAILGSGTLLFLLFQSSQSLKASAREFRRLLSLTSDLAETSEPAVLGDLVARHLAEAIGFDECIIYSVAPETGRLAPFGSHPIGRAVEAPSEILAERPRLREVVRDRRPVLVRASLRSKDDRAEIDHLESRNRQVMLLLPLMTRTSVVGVAELTANQSSGVDGRRLALAQTLAYQATMAIENGRLYQQIRHRSLHDSLTGLANRSLFNDHLEQALARLARRQDGGIAVLFIDLDNFKYVNDTLGHARGDRLLETVADRLRPVVRATDTVARLGGDEFALLLEDTTLDEAIAVGGRVVGSLSAPIELSGQSAVVGASVGVAATSDSGTAPDDLVRQADAAMYAAKRAGKHRVEVYRLGLEKRGA